MARVIGSKRRRQTEGLSKKVIREVKLKTLERAVSNLNKYANIVCEDPINLNSISTSSRSVAAYRFMCAVNLFL